MFVKSNREILRKHLYYGNTELITMQNMKKIEKLKKTFAFYDLTLLFGLLK